MIRVALSSSTAVVVFMTLFGCSFRSVSVGYYDDRPHYRDVYVDHVCSYECQSHYWDGHRLVAIASGHHHRPGCGHRWDGRHWVIVRDDHPDVVIRQSSARRVHKAPARVKRVTHVHSATCGCAWDRRERVWVSLRRGHVHGHNCGHVFVHGKWCLPR